MPQQAPLTLTRHGRRMGVSLRLFDGEEPAWETSS
jgi:hypothetical protein